MATDIGWVAILGAVSGVSSFFIWLLNTIVNMIRKPRLIMSNDPYVRNWKLSPVHIWNFAHFEVVSKKGLAIGCEAKATIIEHPNNVTLVKELTEEGCGLHWADAPYSGRSTSADRVDIGSAPQRLDIAFMVPHQSGQSNLAMPIALNTMFYQNTGVPQAILPKGEYILKIEVSCANGRGDTKTIKLISPDNWQDLQAENFKRASLHKRVLSSIRTWLKRFPHSQA